MKTINSRTTEYPIDNVFLKRYSPRAMSGETITKEELMTLFEAGRWAPSSNNSQPWRFVYAQRETTSFENLLSFLTEHNKTWCQNASTLIVVISKNNFDNGNPSKTHSLNTGMAFENLALQATEMGLISHGMEGFDYTLAKEKLEVSDDYSVEMMIAIGKLGNIEDLPEILREREKPSSRKNLEEIVFEGNFKN